jgi:RimJ/RimL family protein N-acetyltransferase
MQQSWRSDHDKLTFIACLPPLGATSERIFAGTLDASDRLIGDVNLFLSPSHEDPEGCIGELELMIAPTAMRRHGYGRASILTFLHYIQTHLDEILGEYKKKVTLDNMHLLQLKVKIGSKNTKSISLFESIGFIKVGEVPNYFGEIELTFEGLIGKERTYGLLEKYDIKGYRELQYVSSN